MNHMSQKNLEDAAKMEKKSIGSNGISIFIFSPVFSSYNEPYKYRIYLQEISNEYE